MKFSPYKGFSKMEELLMERAYPTPFCNPHVAKLKKAGAHIPFRGFDKWYAFSHKFSDNPRTRKAKKIYWTTHKKWW